MESLKNRILKDGRVVSNEILKVDSFLNHQMDPNLMRDIGIEFEKIFKNEKIDKIFTIEASGIAVAIMTAYAVGVPSVFAKKKKPSTMDSNIITSKVYCPTI